MIRTLLTVAAFAASSTSYACSTNAQGIELASYDNGNIVRKSTNDYANWGFYIWNESAQHWELQAQGWNIFAELEQPMPTDDLIPPAALGYGYNHPPLPNDPITPVEINSVRSPDVGIAVICTKDLPRVVATGVRGGGFGYTSMMVYRGSSYSHASGGGGIGRRAATSVKLDNEINCSASDDDRMLRALDKLKTAPNRGVYLMNYAGGHFQLWAVTAPQFTDKGLQPVTPCIPGLNYR